uniref:Uncharacterized protein LOC107370476 isoform X1 n=1 Tax=Tetranychus evansi TaxID=178897 RepID=A0A3G5ARN7_9ACAR|nr:uncharacterized protein LOC107370476 isoform X1 [Tetranychus evansi]
MKIFISSCILLLSVQFAALVPTYEQQCQGAISYGIDKNGEKKLGSSKVSVSFTPLHDDEDEYLSVFLPLWNSKGEDVKTFVSFEVKGKPYTLYCAWDSDNFRRGKGLFPTYTSACSWRLSITGNRAIAPVTNSSISIDLLTIDDNVPITLGFNDKKTVVAANLKEIDAYQLTFLECLEENRMSFYDNSQKNRIMLKKKIYNKEIETFVYGLIPDQKLIDRSVKYVNADGVSLTIQCNDSFGYLTGFVQQGNKKESIDNLFTFKSLDGYRCGSRLPLLVQTNNIKFDFNARPLDFSFSSTDGSSVDKPNILFHSDNRKWG